MDLINNDNALVKLINNGIVNKYNKKYPFIETLIDCLENDKRSLRDIIKEKCSMQEDRHILFKFIMVYYTLLIQDPDIPTKNIIEQMNNIISDADLRLSLLKLKLTF
jgi:hypothetical protein